MDTQRITLDRGKARELYRAYKKHQHYSEPIDEEIRRAYQLIAQGRMVIRALESIKVAGVFTSDGFPKLAISRADAPKCHLTLHANGSARFSAQSGWRADRSRCQFTDMPAGTFPVAPGAETWQTWHAEAVVPLVPIHLRPKRALENYHILWEAEWTRIIPRDPMLLRRIGRGDMWLVVAAWDLTEVERAALATRLNG